MTDTLKKCPFCEGEPELLDSLFCNNMKQIQCKNCGALSLSHNESCVIKSWNRRVIDAKYEKCLIFFKKIQKHFENGHSALQSAWLLNEIKEIGESE